MREYAGALGLMFEQKLGVNPFKFGLIGDGTTLLLPWKKQLW